MTNQWRNRLTGHVQRLLVQFDQRASDYGFSEQAEIWALPLAAVTLIRDERKKMALQVLECLDVNISSLIADIEALLAQITDQLHSLGIVADEVSGETPTCPIIERLMHEAATESGKLDHNYIGSEHLLLAIAAQAGSGLRNILENHTITYDRILATLRELFGDNRILI